MRPVLALLACLSILPSAVRAENLPAADGPGGVDYVKRWAWERVGQGEKAFNESGLWRMPSPGFWGDEVGYSIQVDRFANGDASNDDQNVEEHQRNNQFTTQTGLADYRHGGDLQGIISRLDYLKVLGVTTLWITPILKHNGSYHGYCTSDFTQVDPGFGTNEKFRELVFRAHERGMKVVMDIVINHLCDNKSGYDNQATPYRDDMYTMCVNDQERKYWTGNGEVRGRRKFNFGDTLFPPFRDENFFTRCGHKGDFREHGPGATFGDFSGAMFDLDTLNWNFQDIFTDLHKFWIAYADVDGFRLDAAKHVTADFIAKFSTDIRKYANSIGKSNFYLVGEVADYPEEQARRLGRMRSNIHNPYDPGSNTPAALRARMQDVSSTFWEHPTSKFPGMNAVYDFTTSGTIGNAWRGERSPLDVKQTMWTGEETENSQCAEGFCEIKGNADPRLSWNVLEIHDWPRFGLHGAGVDRMIGAAANLLTAQGIPMLYYGFEQGLNGICWDTDDRMQLRSGWARDEIRKMCHDHDVMNHSRYRQDMFTSGVFRLGSAVPAINDLAGVGYSTGERSYFDWWRDPYLRTDHGLFKSIRKLIAIRKSCSALRWGQTYFRAAHKTPGLLAFSRVDSGKGNEIVVLLNTSDREIELDYMTVDASINGQEFERWRNLLNGFEVATTGRTDGGGRAIFFHGDFKLLPFGVAIYVKESNIAGYSWELGAETCKE